MSNFQLTGKKKFFVLLTNCDHFLLSINNKFQTFQEEMLFLFIRFFSRAILINHRKESLTSTLTPPVLRPSSDDFGVRNFPKFFRSFKFRSSLKEVVIVEKMRTSKSIVYSSLDSKQSDFIRLIFFIWRK